MGEYPKMKNSELPWVGDIPSHWKITRMKHILQNISEKNHPDAIVLSLYREYGILPKDSRDDNHNVTSLDTGSYKFVRKGELVINKMKAWQGSLGISDYEGIVSPAYYVCHITSDEIEKKYFHYLVRCKAYAQEFERLSTGMRVGQWDLGIDDFMCISAIIPPLREQTAIANYLDEQCAKIDTLITDTKSSIEEYKEWKQSLIFEAVTKGLDSNVKMKEPKNIFIKEIPNSWLCHPFKYIITQNDGGIWGDEPTTNKYTIVLRSTEQTVDGEWSINNPAPRDLSKISNMEYYYLKVNDLLLTKSSGSKLHIGKTTIVNDRIEKMNCCYSNFMQRIRLISDVNAKYYWYILNSTLARKQFVYLQNSTSGIGNINASNIANIYVTQPPIKEQNMIVKFLDSKCAKIDSAILEKQQFIVELEAYKKSLIYEIVTGKRKVV